MAGKKLSSVRDYFDAVKWPSLVTVVLLMGVSLALYRVESLMKYKDQVNTAFWIFLLIVPFYVGFRLASRAGAGPLQGALAGALFGLVAGGLYYGLIAVGSFAGLFGEPADISTVDWSVLGTFLGKEVGNGIVKSAVMGALGLLVGLFVSKMKEAE
ncbi:MAG: hypothetical protein Q7T16_01475 [Candidatus Burarchaeum sp.]|nr:hypothetical protein [Candidatus Burarchaeum sp.]MDO8339307.1 hypothetical protein [Candidatus Burarchaeum sp.]